MLSRFSLLFRLGLIVAVAPAMIVAPAFQQTAIADDDDDDDFGDEDEGDDGGDDGGDDEDKEPQPPVTAGGLFTKKTYPVAEIERTLTLIQGMAEVRGGLDIDVSKDKAFETWVAKIDGRYGIRDNVELQLAVEGLLTGDRVEGTSIGNIAVGVEAGIAYDLVDFRALISLPVTAKNDANNLATESEVGFDLAIGFPVRYRVTPQIAIIALDKFMTIHLAGGKPDLTIGVGGVYQALPNLAAILRGEVTIPQFNTDTIQIPATAAIQFSPNNKIDIGGEFTFKNFKPAKVPDPSDPTAPPVPGAGALDERSILLFAQARF